MAIPLHRAGGQSWADYLRQALSFTLGAVIIVYGVFISTNSLVPELVVGLLLMGFVPVDVVLSHLGVGARPDATPSEPGPGAEATVTPDH